MMEARFLTKVNKIDGGCWEWTGTQSGRYGMFWFNGKNIGSHRISYELWNGEIPTEMIVRHKCDNTRCVNPQHLELGTTQENVNDKIIRNRQKTGEQMSNSKLTDKAVLEIRANTNLTQIQMAELYGVSKSLIQKVLYKKWWKHI